ncbi:MAG: hypothetical protein JW731_11435 [Bacteroidales bacterium]|nr:hypothetical protein [Bacteroidales bacterium]
MKTKLQFLAIILIFITTGLFSQTFEEFKKQRENELQNFKQKQEEFITRMQNEFDEYVKQKDQEFADYLKNYWEQFDVFRGIEPPEMPKPPVMPEYEPKPDREESWNKIPTLKPTIAIEKATPEEIVMPLIKKSEEEQFNESQMTFGFFGMRIILEYDSQVRIDPPAVVNPSTISKFWEMLSGTNYNQLISQLQSYKTRMNLNDWAYFLLVDKFAQTVYEKSPNGKDLLSWVLLNRSGYRTRVAYSGNSLSLLVPSLNTLYSRSFLQMDGIKYYLMSDLGSENIYTYDKDYPDAKKLIDFNLTSPLNLSKSLAYKSIGFDYKDKPYSFRLNYNQNLIDFYKDYPQVDINIYFDATVSAETKESLLESLRPIIAEMTETESVNFLLKFVQSAFQYKTDQQQFQKEKFFFPEEILYYPYSDCEDRSIFFAYLVKELLNIKVVGVEYPGHIATAVKLDEEAPGDYFIYENEKYVIADPTFINAPLGLTMPNYRGADAKIIPMENFIVRGEKVKSLWEIVEESGGFRGNNLQDIVFDSEGNGYLTGYFTGEVQFGEFHLASDPSTRSVFVVKYTKDRKPEWAKKAGGTQNAVGFSIVMTDDNNLYIAGSYSGKLDFEEGAASVQCLEDNADVFIAKYNVEGRFIWARKAGLDTYPQENYLTYMTKFTSDGVNKGTTFFSEDDNFTNFGLNIGPMSMLYLTGSFQNTTGLNVEKLTLAANEGETLNLPESLKAENDILIVKNYERIIAGVFSVINHIEFNGFKVSGRDAQLTLDKYNPPFKKSYPEIYENIGKINFLINDDGIIVIETEGERSVLFDKLKISNGAKIKIAKFENGDARIDCLSGITVGKLMIWFDLNYVRMYKLDGNLLFDYDTDHTQKIMNLKEDILE